MSFYRAYGLTIRSDLPLPELVSSAREPDVHIQINEQLEFPPNFDKAQYTYLSPQVTYIYWESIALVEVRDGNLITVKPAPDVESITLRNYIIGPALNHLLYQRHLFLVHASVIELNGRAVAFVGQSGWGKSTLAAHMHDRGHLFVSDDVLAVDLSTSGNPIVLPGFPQQKLWPDALVSIGTDADTLPRVDSDYEKRAKNAQISFFGAPLPLGCIYIMDRGAHDQPQIEPLNQQEAFKTLLIFTYGQFDAPASPARLIHMQQCAAVVSAVSVCRLRRRRNLDELAELCRLVEQDCG